MSCELLQGEVQEFEKGKARVAFTARGGAVSPWLSVGYPNTKDDKEYWPLAKGETVWCLLADGGESGVIVGCAYTDASPPPADAEQLWTRQFADGTKLTYDRETKALTVEVEGDVTVKSKGAAKLETTGKVTIQAAGTVDVTASIVNLN